MRHPRGRPYAATFHFHDVPPSRQPRVRRASRSTTRVHAGAAGVGSRDRSAAARAVGGISKIHAATSPENKVDIVRRETARAKTLFVGDGINDAPALLTATVGVAFGQRSDVTTEAAGVVIVDTRSRRSTS